MARTAVQSPVIDQNEAVPNRGGIVGQRIDLNQGERSDDGGVGGDAVETDFGLAIGDEGEEIGVGAEASDVLGPGGAPAEDEGALDGGVEAGGAGLAVVVVVDCEGADIVARGGEVGEDVAVLLAGGERGEEAEGRLRGEAEAERLGDDLGGAAGEEAVGEPGGVEGVGVVGGGAAVDVEGYVACAEMWKRAAITVRIGGGGGGGGKRREEEEE